MTIPMYFLLLFAVCGWGAVATLIGADADLRGYKRRSDCCAFIVTVLFCLATFCVLSIIAECFR